MNDRAPSPVATLATTLAGILIWQSSAMLLDRAAAASQLRLVVLLAPQTARLVVTLIATTGIALGVLVIGPRTRSLGAHAAAVSLFALIAYLVVTWSRGDPVQCLCTTSTAARSWWAHLSAIMLVLGVALLATFVGRAGRALRRRALTGVPAGLETDDRGGIS